MKLLLVQCAALGYQLTQENPALKALGLDFRPMTPPFPAVTCTASATMRTAAPPSSHGIVCNGRYDRGTCTVGFWLQSARLCRGERIWQHNPNCKNAMVFHQQNLGEDADITLSPAPVHKHHGGMVQACQTTPPELEARLNAVIGRKFDLMNYWGPLANGRSSDWIARATIDIMEKDAPALLMTYIPHLDYVLQKLGPAPSKRLDRECECFAAIIHRLLDAARRLNYEAVVWGDYAITPVSTPIYINKALKAAGLFKTRTVDGGATYPNLYDSAVVAMADHQIAHIYVQQPGVLDKAREVIQALPGVASVQPKAEAGIDAPEAGDLVATAASDAWFTYRWWDDDRQAPDYASHIDIHSKIGFDPCELFFGFPPPFKISTDPAKVRGSHGRTDAPAAFAVTENLAGLRAATSLLELSSHIKKLI